MAGIRVEFGRRIPIFDLQELNALCSCARDLYKYLDNGDHQIESLAQVSTNFLSHLRLEKAKNDQFHFPN